MILSFSKSRHWWLFWLLFRGWSVTVQSTCLTDAQNGKHQLSGSADSALCLALQVILEAPKGKGD